MKTKAKSRFSYIKSQEPADVRDLVKLTDAFNAGYEACEQTYCFPKSATERPPEKQLYIPDPYVLINKSDDIDLKQQMAALTAYMDECQKRILQLEESNSSKKLDGWISVKDRLPKIGDRILVTHRKGQDYANLHVMEASRFNDDEYCLPQDYSILADYVDYWMPLPKPPEEI